MIIWKKICATLSCVAVIMSMISGNNVWAEDLEGVETATEIAVQENIHNNVDIEDEGEDKKTGEVSGPTNENKIPISDEIKETSLSEALVEDTVLAEEGEETYATVYSMEAPKIAPDAASFEDGDYDVFFEKFQIQYCRRNDLEDDILLRIEVLRNNEELRKLGGYGISYSTSKNKMTDDFSMCLTESGTYKIRVYWEYVKEHDNGTLESVRCSEYTEYVYNYIRPQYQLETVVGYWDEVTPCKLHFNAVEGADGYQVLVYAHCKFNEKSAMWLEPEWFDSNGSDRILFSYDSSGYTVNLKSIESEFQSFAYEAYNGEIDKLVVAIRALSDEPSEIASSEFGGFSEVYDVVAQSVSYRYEDEILHGLNMQKLSETRSNIYKKLNLTEIVEGMQELSFIIYPWKAVYTSSETENYWFKESVVLSDEIYPYIDGSIIPYGLELNADSFNDSIYLEISQPDTMKSLDSQYSNCIQFDIKLNKNGTYIHNLDFPISIEMTVPKGIDASKLIILHYLEDGGVEEVPYQLSDNYDGSKSMRFTVTQLSTFVFTEASEVVDNATVATENVSNIMTSPKTTDTTHIWIAIMLLLTSISGMSIMVLRKRR